MVFEAILRVIMIPLELLIHSLPGAYLLKISSFVLPDILEYGVYFFPMDCLIVAITSFLGWYGILIGWSTIEWIYKKIPGVD